MRRSLSLLLALLLAVLLNGVSQELALAQEPSLDLESLTVSPSPSGWLPEPVGVSAGVMLALGVLHIRNGRRMYCPRVTTGPLF